MEWYWALATLIGMVIFFMALGVPVAFTFIITNIIAVIRCNCSTRKIRIKLLVIKISV